MPLCKVENIKNITLELNEKWMKDNMWFTFYRYCPSFSSRIWFDDDDSYLEHKKECDEYMNNPPETIYVKDIEELFSHEKLVCWVKNHRYEHIRFRTKEDKLYVDYIHPQCVDRYGEYFIGTTSNNMIGLIDRYITIRMINKSEEI